MGKSRLGEMHGWSRADGGRVQLMYLFLSLQIREHILGSFIRICIALMGNHLNLDAKLGSNATSKH